MQIKNHIQHLIICYIGCWLVAKEQPVCSVADGQSRGHDGREQYDAPSPGC